MNALRIAVVGAGHLGKIHARLLKTLPQVDLLGIVDPSEDARSRAFRELEIPVHSDYHPFLERLDAVVVAAPSSLHHAIGMELLQRRIHVLMEKPLAATAGQAEELVQAAAASSVVLQVGHVEQFNPALLAARPRLVTPHYVEAVRTSSYTFRSTDIGVVLDLMIHDLDVILSLVSSEVTKVDAIGMKIFGPHEDIAQARLNFANGCVANLTASRVSHQAQRSLRLFAPEQLTTIDFAQGTATIVQPAAPVRERKLDAERMTVEEKLHYKERLFHDFLPLEQLAPPAINAIQEEQRAFIESIRSGTPVCVDGRQALYALQVAERVVDAIALTQSRSAAPLQGPHWQTAPARYVDPHRRAG